MGATFLLLIGIFLSGYVFVMGVRIFRLSGFSPRESLFIAGAITLICVLVNVVWYTSPEFRAEWDAILQPK